MSLEPESTPSQFPLPRREVGVRPVCIIIAGPTASGKTDIAIRVAKHFQTEIISADSRQCYKELNIGVAKPSAAQLSEVPHHFINSHSINDDLSAADFEGYALSAAEKIFEKNDVVVMCGGTGLYIKAFCEGLDPIPKIDPGIKSRLTELYRQQGLGWLQSEVENADPLFWEKGENQNPHRLLRALEVMQGTGTSLISLQQNQKKQRNFGIVKIALDLPRETLYERINHRVDLMRQEGLKDEARNLFPYKALNALQTVGYRELFDFFEGKISEERAFELIKQNTRHYAKRQVTWFKKEGFEWIDANRFPTDLHGWFHR